MSFHSFVELSQDHSARYPERVAFRFLGRKAVEHESVTLGALDRDARALAVKIAVAAKVGDRALLLFPPGPAFIRAFWGCLYAGVIAVPCYPPGITRASEQAVSRILADSGASVILTIREWLPDRRIHGIATDARQPVTWIETETVDPAQASAWREPSVRADRVAFLQYTSGSTGSPKGVMVTHANLLANVEMIDVGFQGRSDDRVCLWLPPYHDMGLIGGILGSVNAGVPLSLMSPAEFLRSPLTWLRAISAARATITGAPNFAFDLCVRAIASKPAGSLDIDLSSLEVVCIGAEVVRSDTLRRFSEHFRPYGFRAESFAPCYGMAECTLLCSITPRLRGARVSQRPGASAERAADDGGGGTTDVVGCGRPVPGQRVVIVDPDSCLPCPEGATGEVWISGPHVAKGYWGNSKESKQVFGAHLADDPDTSFLRTGDRGFFSDGEVHLVGRYKNIIIVRGRNFAAEDLELSVARAHGAVRPSRVAAFPSPGPDGDEACVLLECEREVLDGHADDVVATMYQAILGAVKQTVRETHGLDPKIVAILAAGQLPVTTSGKVRRQAARALFESEGLKVLASLRAAPVSTAPMAAKGTLSGDELFAAGPRNPA